MVSFKYTLNDFVTWKINVKKHASLFDYSFFMSGIESPSEDYMYVMPGVPNFDQFCITILNNNSNH